MDTLLPAEMAVKAESLGVAKATMPAGKTFVLAVLAGAFIALGAVFFTSVTAGSPLSYGITRLVGGVCFSLGLVLVIVGGAELFTGNNLIIMAWANQKISVRQLLRNWSLVYAGNAAGALFIVLLMLVSRQYLSDDGRVGLHMLQIAKLKCEMNFTGALASGILCNMLVCLAVWLCFSSSSVSGKILSVVFPITAFVACGFEHSVANLYFVPKAIFLLQWKDPAMEIILQHSGKSFESLNWTSFILNNLLPVTLGNIIGGAVLVGMVYWFVYLRKSTD